MEEWMIWVITIFAGLCLLAGIGYWLYLRAKKKAQFKTKQAEEKEKFNEKYAYRVTIADKFSKTIREVSTFGVEKRRSDENILTLTNEKQRFEEFFPYDEQSNKFSKEFVEGQLELAKKKMKDNTTNNPYNLKSEILKWEKIHHNLSSDGGEFMKIDTDGVPHILFVRHGSVNIPWKWNSESMHIQPPSDPFIKDVVTSRDDKRKKYLEKNLKFREVMVSIGLFIMLCMMITNGFWSYFNAKFDDTDIKKMQERIDNAPLLCAEYLGTASDNFVKASQNSVIASQNALNITETAASWVNKPISKSVPVTNVE